MAPLSLLFLFNVIHSPGVSSNVRQQEKYLVENILCQNDIKSCNVMESGHWVMLFKFSNFISKHHSIYSINFYRGNGFCIKIIIKKII
jgi:hypothetical protein